MTARRLAALLLLAAAGPVHAADTPPVVYAQRTASYDVSLRIDPALKRYGGVFVSYRDGAMKGFNSFEREADQMHALQGAGGSRWVDQVEYTLTVETPHLLGVLRRSYVDRHTAHPDIGVQGLILDRGSGRPLGATDLLQPGTDMAPLDSALQAALDHAKSQRHNGQPPPIPPGSALLTWDSGRPAINPRRTPPSDATLAPSTEPGKAGGLQFVFGPHDNGIYSDGAYRVLLPLEVFAAKLKPQYREDFAGAPASLGDDPTQGLAADAAP